jgi:peptidoglycan/LPS O-acetylase OafA/YrhL
MPLKKQSALPAGTIPEKKRYPYLDALRGIAILLVIGVHTTMFTMHNTPGFLYILSGEGARGVQLFYIVSALTLFMSLQMSSFLGKKKEQIKFFFRRFFRITPMFYCTVASFYIIVAIFPSWKEILSLNINPISLISTITFTNNFIPQYINNVVPGDWSIAIEMFFYLTVPLLFLRIKDLATAKKYFLWSLGCACLLELVLPLCFPVEILPDLKNFLFYSIPIQLPVFMLGIVTFFILFKDEKENNSVSYKKEFLFLFAVTCMFEIIFVIIKFLLTHTIDSSLITPRIYIESVCFIGLIMLISKGYTSFLQNKVLQYIGTVSYSVYLVQFISFIIITKNNLYPLLAVHLTNDYVEYLFLFIMASALSIGIASLTFRYIEKPGQRLGVYLFKKVTASL